MFVAPFSVASRWGIAKIVAGWVPGEKKEEYIFTWSHRFSCELLLGAPMGSCNWNVVDVAMRAAWHLILSICFHREVCMLGDCVWATVFPHSIYIAAIKTKLCEWGGKKANHDLGVECVVTMPQPSPQQVDCNWNSSVVWDAHVWSKAVFTKSKSWFDTLFCPKWFDPHVRFIEQQERWEGASLCQRCHPPPSLPDCLGKGLLEDNLKTLNM